MKKFEQKEINKYIGEENNPLGIFLPDKSFNAISLNYIIDVMKEKNLKRSDIIKMTNLPKRTVYSIFESEERFLKASFENVLAILKALGIAEKVNVAWANTISDYSERDEKFKIIAQTDKYEKNEFLLTKEDFNFVLSLLKKMNCRNEDD